MALSESVKELKFISMLLNLMGIRYSKPITVWVDNLGAIFMSNNPNASGRTRHMDIKHHFIRDYIDDLISIKFITTDANIADIFTKNTSSSTFVKHQATMVDNLGSEAFLEKEEGC